MAKVFGVKVPKLDDGMVAIEVIVLVKALDGIGEPVWLGRHSTGLSDFEKMGILQAEHRRLSDHCQSNWSDSGVD